MSKAEKFIQDCIRNCSNELCTVEDKSGKKVISYHEWLTPDQARRAVEIARKELLINACEWLKNWAYFSVNDYTGRLNEDNLVGRFREAMENE